MNEHTLTLLINAVNDAARKARLRFLRTSGLLDMWHAEWQQRKNGESSATKP